MPEQSNIRATISELEMELRATQQRQSQIQGALSALKALSQGEGPTPPQVRIPEEARTALSNPFTGMSIPQAVEQVLRSTKHPLSPGEITDAVQKAGHGNAKRHQAYKNVYAALTNGKGKAFKRVGDKWALKG